MPSVLRQDFKSTVVKAGSYTNPTPRIGLNASGQNVHLADNNSPLLQDSNGAAMVAGQAGGVGSHYRLPAGIKFTCELGVDAQSGGKVVSFRPRGVGGEHAVFLPYCDNYICSSILPAQGVNYFFTDNLSGCAVYVDQVHGSDDLIVYHANARATQGTNGDVAATNLMDQMHTAAKNDYSGWLGNAVVDGGSIKKAQYFGQAIAHYTNHKTGQGRTNVQTLGEGTNVMGFRHNNRWEFWYQTWALASYDRPDKTWGKLTKGATQAAALGQGKILRAERFWRQP